MLFGTRFEDGVMWPHAQKKKIHEAPELRLKEEDSRGPRAAQKNKIHEALARPKRRRFTRPQNLGLKKKIHEAPELRLKDPDSRGP